MSKAIKKIGRAVKKGIKWVSKNIGPILAVAALIYTGGAAMGYFQGVAGGAGATGMAGIKAAIGNLVGTTAAAGSAGAATAGTTAASTTATAAAAAPGLMAPAAVPGAVVNAGVSAASQAAAAAAAPAAAAGGGMTVGQGLMAAAGIQAGGAYLQTKAAEDAEEEERARQDREKAEYNRNMYAYGVNRNGDRSATYSGGDWSQMMAPAPAGLMAPKPVAPQTIDELIRARQQGTA